MMDFSFDDTQSALRDLARDVFSKHATHDRLKELEAGGESFDRDLWETLERSGLTSMGVDGGFLEQCIVLVEQGRTVAPVPLWGHLIASTVTDPGDGILTLAVGDAAVPAFEVATGIVRVEPDGLSLVSPGEAPATRHETTTRFPEHSVDFADARSTSLEGDPTVLEQKAVVGLCAIGLGAAERALELTASYTSERKQFGQPLGSFQAVQQRAADAYIDVEAMRVTMWQAAWRLANGLDAEREVAIAKFWTADGGQRVAQSAQHLHGGMGADIDYPLYRYTLWLKWVELKLGSATRQLLKLGEMAASDDRDVRSAERAGSR